MSKYKSSWKKHCKQVKTHKYEIDNIIKYYKNNISVKKLHSFVQNIDQSVCKSSQLESKGVQTLCWCSMWRVGVEEKNLSLHVSCLLENKQNK